MRKSCNKNWYYSDLKLDPDKYCDTGDLLYAWSASFGPRIWEGEKVIYHYHIWKVIPNPSLIEKKFLFYFLEWDTILAKAEHGTGTTMIHVSKGSMEEREIYYPSLSEQRRIVEILDEAFAAIDQARANAERNKANSRELFDSYLNAIFTNSSFEWERESLGNLSEVQSGGTPSTSRTGYWNGDIAWYSSGELNQQYTTEPKNKITKEGLDNSNAKLFPKGSLLIGMYDTAALKMSITDREATFNQAIAGVKPNCKVNLHFAMHAINFVKQDILSQRRGVRQKNLNLGKIKAIPIPLPPLVEQNVIVTKLEHMASQSQLLEKLYQQKIDDLNELKQSLLNQAFTGQLTKHPESSLEAISA